MPVTVRRVPIPDIPEFDVPYRPAYRSKSKEG